ncbi:hypothetical protein [Thalassolituus marinus]|nr:hypothetical protein [Thalassolituus marinus]
MPAVTPARSKRPCQFCQRSRWAMTFVILASMLAVTLLNTNL